MDNHTCHTDLISVMHISDNNVMEIDLSCIIAVRNGDVTLTYLSSYETECLITNITTL